MSTPSEQKEIAELKAMVQQLMNKQNVVPNNSQPATVPISPEISHAPVVPPALPPMPPIPAPVAVPSKKPQRKIFSSIIKRTLQVVIFVLLYFGILFVLNFLNMSLLALLVVSFVVAILIFGGGYLIIAKMAGDSAPQLSFPTNAKLGDRQATDVHHCPKCRGKLMRSHVTHNGVAYRQLLKCKNPNCDFQEEITFKE